ncbi:MAG: WD40 repeat domain-containing protein, partial [Blastocatellia bacterium]
SWDSTLKVWDAMTGEMLRTLEGHSAYVIGCAFSPDGKLIVSASSDRTLKVWDAMTGEMLRTLEGHSDSVSGCAFSPDGQLIVSASDDSTLKVWDAESGKCAASFYAEGPIFCCDFSDDNVMIVAGGARGVYFLRLVR